MSESGYIKYKCVWIKTGPLPDASIENLEGWRAKLRDLGLIGSSANGIGYGNISQRIDDTSQFLITGSNTGHLKTLGGSYYTRVISYDFDGNTLTCEGPIQASSESLTHAAIYETDSRIKGVIHVHSQTLWQFLINKVPTTSENVEYGTPEMAAEMIRLLKDSQAARTGIVVMGGHKEGLVTFGKTVADAGEILLRYYHGETVPKL